MQTLAIPGKRVARASWLIVMIATALTAQEVAPKPGYVVVVPVTNMYHAPSLDSDVVSQAIYGSNVAALEIKSEWANIRTADDYTGWTLLANLRRLNSPYAVSGAVVKVAQRTANLYRDPDVTRQAPLLTLPFDSRMEVLSGAVDNNPRWLKVRLADSAELYVQAGDVSSDLTPLTIDQMMEMAKKFLGVTYTWGGSSAFGFDCSGFTQMLERQRGVIMPRDADQQAAWSGVASVDRKDLQAGDLLFFGESATHITHTGMYLGNGEFIHDTTHEHPGVQISKLDDSPWTTLLVAARRVKP